MLYSVDFYNRFGAPDIKFERKEMSVFIVPEYYSSNCPFIPARIYCNHQMHVPLEVAFYNMVDRGVSEQVKSWDGCFHIRSIRGKEKAWRRHVNMNRWDLAAPITSVHAWGCAIDMNQAWNQYGRTPTMRKELVACFTDAGFIWGGSWDYPDGMHFQLEYLTS